MIQAEPNLQGGTPMHLWGFGKSSGPATQELPNSGFAKPSDQGTSKLGLLPLLGTAINSE